MRHNGNIPSVSPFCDEGKWNEIVKQRRKKNNELTWEIWGMRVNKTIKQQWSKKKKKQQQHTHVDRTRYKHEKHTRIGYQQLICCISLAVYIDAILHHRTTAAAAAANILMFLHFTPYVVSQRARDLLPFANSIVRSKHVPIRTTHSYVSVFASDTFNAAFSVSAFSMCVQTDEEQESTHQPIQ